MPGSGSKRSSRARPCSSAVRPSCATARSSLPPHARAWQDEAEAQGQTVVAAAWDGVFHGLLALADTLKPTSAEAIRELKALGLTPVLLTGDNEHAARAIAREVGIEHVRAGVLPSGKAAEIERLQRRGRDGRDGRRRRQ